MTFLVPDIPGIPAVAALIHGFQIVLRETGGDEEVLFAAAEDGELFFQ